MKLILFDRNVELAVAWRQSFEGQPDVHVTTQDFRTIDCDAIVSPANSFGFMDGGIDLALSEFLGWDVQERLQAEVRRRPMRELLVGEALVVPTKRQKPAWLISAPTMRVPMRVRESINAYLAMKAVLLAARFHDADPAIESVAVPGLATGIGSLSPQIAAHQMWTAYHEIVLGETEFPDSFGQAQQFHIRLNTGANLSE